MRIAICSGNHGWELHRILPHVYHLHFESPYLLAMHFIRAQEYYESPKFADKIFSLVDYMEWYVKEYKKTSFTYPEDWSGFNVPCWVLGKIFGEIEYEQIQDKNLYDRMMRNIYKLLRSLERVPFPRAKINDFYLIGTSSAGYKGDGDEEGVLDHEIAHALYYTNEEYRKEADKQIARMGRICMPGDSTSVLTAAMLGLETIGYHKRTIRDEIQAYASTGTIECLNMLRPSFCRPFQENFQKYKDLLIPAR